MEKGKTIKQIAEELGVTKQAVHQKRKSKALSTALQPFTTTVDGIVYISVDGEKLIKQAFSDIDCKQVDGSFTTTVDGSFTPSFTPETPLYEILKGELEAKNKQIEALTVELAKEREHSREQSERMAVLADQAQKLQLAQMKPQLTDGGADPQAETPPQEKASLFHRLFGNKK